MPPCMFFFKQHITLFTSSFRQDISSRASGQHAFVAACVECFLLDLPLSFEHSPLPLAHHVPTSSCSLLAAVLSVQIPTTFISDSQHMIHLFSCSATEKLAVISTQPTPTAQNMDRVTDTMSCLFYVRREPSCSPLPPLSLLSSKITRDGI